MVDHVDLDNDLEEFVQAAATEAPAWPVGERRTAGRPWSDRPAATVPDDLSGLDWSDLVLSVYSIDSTAWSAQGNNCWQDAHPDAWEERTPTAGWPTP